MTERVRPPFVGGDFQNFPLHSACRVFQFDIFVPLFVFVFVLHIRVQEAQYGVSMCRVLVRNLEIWGVIHRRSYDNLYTIYIVGSKFNNLITKINVNLIIKVHRITIMFT